MCRVRQHVLQSGADHLGRVMHNHNKAVWAASRSRSCDTDHRGIKRSAPKGGGSSLHCVIRPQLKRAHCRPTCIHRGLQAFDVGFVVVVALVVGMAESARCPLVFAGSASGRRLRAGDGDRPLPGHPQPHPATPSSRRSNTAPRLSRHVRQRPTEGPVTAGDLTEVIPRADVLAVVFGPDGSTVMRRDDTGEDAWSALWNGDEAHDVQATGMLSAIVAPLAAGGVPVWVVSSYDGDLVLVPTDRLDEASEMLQAAGHQVRR